MDLVRHVSSFAPALVQQHQWWPRQEEEEEEEEQRRRLHTQKDPTRHSLDREHEEVVAAPGASEEQVPLPATEAAAAAKSGAAPAPAPTAMPAVMPPALPAPIHSMALGRQRQYRANDHPCSAREIRLVLAGTNRASSPSRKNQSRRSPLPNLRDRNLKLPGPALPGLVAKDFLLVLLLLVGSTVESSWRHVQRPIRPFTEQSPRLMTRSWHWRHAKSSLKWLR